MEKRRGDNQLHGREGSFRGRLRNLKAPEKSHLEQSYEERMEILHFLSNSEKRTNLQSSVAMWLHGWISFFMFHLHDSLVSYKIWGLNLFLYSTQDIIIYWILIFRITFSWMLNELLKLNADPFFSLLVVVFLLLLRDLKNFSLNLWLHSLTIMNLYIFLSNIWIYKAFSLRVYLSLILRIL